MEQIFPNQYEITNILDDMFGFHNTFKTISYGKYKGEMYTDAPMWWLRGQMSSSTSTPAIKKAVQLALLKRGDVKKVIIQTKKGLEVEAVMIWNDHQRIGYQLDKLKPDMDGCTDLFAPEYDKYSGE